MSLDTYANLQTAVATWFKRADLTSSIPDGIALAEAKMNRYLRTKDMVTQNTNFSITGEYVAVPTNFGGVKTFYLNTNPTQTLEYMADEEMTSVFQGNTGIPGFYNVQGANFRFGAVPDATYSATLAYWLKVPALSASNTSNWVLTSHPDAYLYGTMGEMCGFLRDFEGAQAWETQMYRVMDEIAGISAKDQWGGVSMSVRVA